MAANGTLCKDYAIYNQTLYNAIINGQLAGFIMASLVDFKLAS